MAEDRDVQASTRSPVRQSKEEKQQRIPRPSRPSHPPRKFSLPKAGTDLQSTALPNIQDSRTDVVPSQLQTTDNPSTRDQGTSLQPNDQSASQMPLDQGASQMPLDQGASQIPLDQGASQEPCARLRHLATVDGGVALERLYAIIQRQRDDWYQSNYASGSPPSAIAAPQNESTPTPLPVNNQNRTYVTPGVASGGITGQMESPEYTEPSRVITPFTGSSTSEFSRGPTQYDQGQATGASRQLRPAGYCRDPQSVRFQAPLVSPSDPMFLQTKGLGTKRDGLPSDNTPLSAGMSGQTAFQQTGQDISGGTLESSSDPQSQGQDLSGGTLESTNPRQQQEQNISGATQQPLSSRRPSAAEQTETVRLGNVQRSGQDAKGETPKADSLQQLGPAGNTRRSSLKQTSQSNALPQRGTRQSETSPQLPQSFRPSAGEISRCSCGCLGQLLGSQRGSQQLDRAPQYSYLQRPATQPCGGKLPDDCQPPRTSHFQAPLGSPRPEEHASGIKGIVMPEPSSNRDSPEQSNGRTNNQGSLQNVASIQSPRTSGMEVSKGAPHEFPLSNELPLTPRYAETANQVSDKDSMKVTDKPEGPLQDFSGQASKPPSKIDSLGKELRGPESTIPMRFPTAAQSQVAPTAPDPQTFEEQVSAEFRILRELALSLNNLRHMPPAIPPPLGTAFENCVLSEIRSIRSRCTCYTLPGIYNQPNFLVGENGTESPIVPQNTNKAPEPQELNQGQGLYDANQVSPFEQKVITTLRSINRICDNVTSSPVDQTSTVKDTIADRSQDNATRLFEELVLNRLNGLGMEFGCKQTAQPAVSSGVEPSQTSHLHPDPVTPTTDQTSGTSRAPDTPTSQGGARRPSEPSQQTSKKPDEQSPPQSNTPRNQSFSRDGNEMQPMEPSYIKDSSQGTTPFAGRIGSLTFDTTVASPVGTNRTEQSHIQNEVVQSKVEPGREESPTKDQSRRGTLEAAAPPQSGATDQSLVQRVTHGTANELPYPRSVAWVNNDPTFQRASPGPQKTMQMQETIYTRPTVNDQRLSSLRPSIDNRDDRITDECETGSIDDYDSDSSDSCSPRRLTFSQPPYVSPRDRKSNQTFVDCDYSYRASEESALTDCQRQLSTAVRRPPWQTAGQAISTTGPPDLTQYTMSDTQPSQSPLVGLQDPESEYNRLRTSIRSSATVPLSSTLKEGHALSAHIPLPSDLPSLIETERHRTTSTLESFSRGIHDQGQGLQNRSYLRPYGGSSGPQQPLETGQPGQGLRSSFDCSEIYYKVASNVPLVNSRYHRTGPSSPGVCDQLDREESVAEDSLCWDAAPNTSTRPGFAPMDRDDDFDCTTGLQRGRPLEREGLLRKEGAGTPWPRPIGARNRWPPLQDLDCSGERLRATRKPPTTDSGSRRSSRRGGLSSGRTFSGLQPTSDPRCRPTKAQRTKRSPVTSPRVADCMGVAPTRPKYPAADSCTTSESETDCEY